MIAFVELCLATHRNMSVDANGLHSEMWGIVNGIRLSIYPLFFALMLSGIIGLYSSLSLFYITFLSSIFIYIIYIFYNIMY